MPGLAGRLSLAAALALAGCGWKSDGLARLEAEYPSAPAQVVAQGCVLPDDPEAADPGVATGSCMGLLQGRWAARLVELGVIRPIGLAWNLTLADLFVAELSADKKSVELTFCDQPNTLTGATGPIEFGNTSIPDRLKAALGRAKVILPLPGDGSFHAADVVWLWGVRDLADPLRDDLPTAADLLDPRLWDQDGDGRPGVTMAVGSPNGDRYMARRSRWTFGQGRVDGGWITGPLAFAVDQNALGASIDLLKTVAPISPRTECQSLYQLRCVDAAFTCDTLIANQKTLFRDAPK